MIHVHMYKLSCVRLRIQEQEPSHRSRSNPYYYDFIISYACMHACKRIQPRSQLIVVQSLCSMETDKTDKKQSYTWLNKNQCSRIVTKLLNDAITNKS